MKVTRLVGSILATSALACSPAGEDAEAPEVLGTEHDVDATRLVAHEA